MKTETKIPKHDSDPCLFVIITLLALAGAAALIR